MPELSQSELSKLELSKLELSKSELEELTADLLKLRSELQETLEHIAPASQAVALDQQAFGRVSRVDALQQQSIARASQSQSQNRLRQMLKALARVDSGDYGFCVDCDQPVGFARLKVRPETSRCLACQSLQEIN